MIFSDILTLAASDVSPAAEEVASHAVNSLSKFDTVSILLVVTSVFGFINSRWLRLPSTIALMLLGLLLALVLTAVGHFVPGVVEPVREFIGSIDFNRTVLDILLCFLLFAGAMHVNIDDLVRNRYVIGLLATVGVMVSTFLVAGFVYFLSSLLKVDLDFRYCLVFGALISPTDPVAVLAILKKVGAPDGLRTKMAGESLFNDGVGVVVFIVLTTMFGMTDGHGHGGGDETMGAIAIGQLFLQEVAGGLLVGFVIGMVGFFLIKQVHDYDVEVLLTLAMVMGGYSLASSLGASGPLAMVVAGLWIGNYGRRLAMSEKTRQHLDTFWELIDELLNAFLFALLGLEMLVLTLEKSWIIFGLLCIPVVLLARFLAVGGPVTVLKRYREFTNGVIPILTWGGLRGAISVALVLSLKPIEGDSSRDILLVATYACVIFSIGVQGLTVGKLIRSKVGTAPPLDPAH